MCMNKTNKNEKNSVRFSEMERDLLRQKAHLIKRLKDKRIEMGISQSELAEMIGTKQPAINRMESFVTENVSMDFILKVAIALNISISIKQNSKPSNSFIKKLWDEYF
jgi:transcriptional regulator with XRE-family HTH domain